MSRATCIILAIHALVGLPCAAAQATAVRAQDFDVAYSVSEAALPLTEVELWFTRDEGATWELYGRDEDRHSPVRFRAPQEGLFGFFLVLHNSTGPSSAPPSPGDQPHQWAFVDYTAPLVQLHTARITSSLGERLAQIRWTAIDSQLGPRPIQLEYRENGSEQWQSISAEPLSNTGRFDWRIPRSLQGSVSLRVAVGDRGGNRAVSEPQVLPLEEPSKPPAEEARPGSPAPRGHEANPGPAKPVAPGDEPGAVAQSGPGATIQKTWGAQEDSEVTLAGSERARERVIQLMEAASQSAARGETADAIAKLREVVRLDPQKTEAFVSLGALLRQTSDLDRALHAYEIALQQDPQLRDALVGSALVLRETREYESAAGRLRTALRYVPDDAEAWMILGDVAVFQGNDLLARDYYTRATKIDPTATQVIADAQQRLAILTRN